MSITFVVLGLGFLAGGAYAIVEGWPYLLIERGFTLVIIGTVLMTAGVLMLALSRVMAELRRVRGQLANAIMAVSVASMASSQAGIEPVPQASHLPDDAGSPAGPAAIGAAAAAGAILAAGAGAAGLREAPDAADGEASVDSPENKPNLDEPDLFALPEQDAVAPATTTPDISAPWETSPDAQAEPVLASDAPAVSEALPVATREEFEAALGDATGQAAPPEPVEADPFAVAEPVHDLESAAPETAPPALESAGPVDEDFDRLRDRLALGGDVIGADRQAAPTLEGERREAFGTEIDAAADWMTAIRPGRDRWGAAPIAAAPEAEDEPAFDPPPVWPPQTREAAPFEPEAAAPEPEQAEAEEPMPMPMPAPARGEPDAEPELLSAFAPLPDPAEAEDEPGQEPGPADPPAPAASEEGIVGAYQVGTAHFTIYADGSIQARTPDGDYSFASMDELKTYLASEKSRIGG